MLTPSETQLLNTLPEGVLADALRANGLPHRRVEDWKWSDLRKAATQVRQASGTYAQGLTTSPLRLELAGGMMFGNGIALPNKGSLPSGVQHKEEIASPSIFPQSPMASLASAACRHIFSISEALNETLVLRHLSDGDGYHTQRYHIDVAKGVHATLIEIHEAQDTPFANALTTIHLRRGASLQRIIVQINAPKAILVHTSMPALEADASLCQTTLAFGAAFARHETHVALMGKANVKLDGLYHLKNASHNDFTSHIHYMAPGSIVDQLCKGVVDDTARSVYQGKFLVESIAQQTDAKMGHHALLLTDGASINAKPELEIYADDVECAHGNSVGALDEDAIFYMRQRGLSEAAAKDQLIDAFGLEVLSRLEDKTLADALAKLYQEGRNR